MPDATVTCAIDIPREQQAANHVALLTGGNDKHYASGLVGGLAAHGIAVDFICSDDLDCPEVRALRGVRMLNLRGDQREDVRVSKKVRRVLRYYARLIAYTWTAKPRILHILWNNKFEYFDRTALMLYYRLLGKRVFLTAHNVNVARRDSRDSVLNRCSLTIQYRLCSHIFVHTPRMKSELIDDFGVRQDAVSVIPYGINDAVPMTAVTRAEARAELGLGAEDKVVLLFGQIAPYKGVEYLLEAIRIAAEQGLRVRVVLPGKVKQGWQGYWDGLQQTIAEKQLDPQVIKRIQFIPDEQIERYFKAADALVLPYTEIFQSGVLFLAYSFGLPVIATDVGSLRDDIVEGETGFVCAPRDAESLAGALARYFSSELYRTLEVRRPVIARTASDRHSWARVGEITRTAYRHALSAS